MIELKFSGESYADVLAGCKDWLAQQEAIGAELTALARAPQPVPAQPVPGQPYAPIQTQPYPAVSVPVPAPVPTAAPEYTQENLMNAGARLMTTVGLPAMQQLLARFGVPAIHQLPKERYGEFAQALRDMGGTL